MCGELLPLMRVVLMGVCEELVLPDAKNLGLWTISPVGKLFNDCEIIGCNVHHKVWWETGHYLSTQLPNKSMEHPSL